MRRLDQNELKSPSRKRRHLSFPLHVSARDQLRPGATADTREIETRQRETLNRFAAFCKWAVRRSVWGARPAPTCEALGRRRAQRPTLFCIMPPSTKSWLPSDSLLHRRRDGDGGVLVNAAARQPG